MTILDTNVLSETLKVSPSPVVMGWLASLNAETVFTTAITQAEMLRGMEQLPAGRRKSQLSVALGNIFAREFDGRILAFDEDAAPEYAEIAARRARAGRPISQSDAMIAAICKCHGAVAATRNTSDFEHCGVKVIDPWGYRG